MCAARACSRTATIQARQISRPSTTQCDRMGAGMWQRRSSRLFPPPEGRVSADESIKTSCLPCAAVAAAASPSPKPAAPQAPRAEMTPRPGRRECRPALPAARRPSRRPRHHRRTCASRPNSAGRPCTAPHERQGQAFARSTAIATGRSRARSSASAWRCAASVSARYARHAGPRRWEPGR